MFHSLWSIASFLNLEDLLTTADFLVEIETLKQILVKAQDSGTVFWDVCVVGL